MFLLQVLLVMLGMSRMIAQLQAGMSILQAMIKYEIKLNVNTQMEHRIDIYDWYNNTLAHINEQFFFYRLLIVLHIHSTEL